MSVKQLGLHDEPGLQDEKKGMKLLLILLLGVSAGEISIYSGMEKNPENLSLNISITNICKEKCRHCFPCVFCHSVWVLCSQVACWHEPCSERRRRASIQLAMAGSSGVLLPHVEERLLLLTGSRLQHTAVHQVGKNHDPSQMERQLCFLWVSKPTP